MGRKGLAAAKAIFVPHAKASAVSIRAALQSKRSEAVRGRSVGRSRSLGSGIRDASYGRVGMNSISICHLRRRLQPRE